MPYDMIKMNQMFIQKNESNEWRKKNDQVSEGKKKEDQMKFNEKKAGWEKKQERHRKKEAAA